MTGVTLTSTTLRVTPKIISFCNPVQAGTHIQVHTQLVWVSCASQSASRLACMNRTRSLQLAPDVQPEDSMKIAHGGQLTRACGKVYETDNLTYRTGQPDNCIGTARNIHTWLGVAATRKRTDVRFKHTKRIHLRPRVQRRASPVQLDFWGRYEHIALRHRA